MGANQSTGDVQDAVNEVEQNMQPGERGIKLYKFVRKGTAGDWETVTQNARYRFYDAKEDTGKGKAEWWLDVADVDVKVDQELGYVVDLKQRRVTFTADGNIYALKFPSVDQYRSFAEELNDCAFYNTYGVENDAGNRTKVLGDDYTSTFFCKDAADRADEPMDTDPDQDVQQTPEAMKEREAIRQRRDAEDDEEEDGDEEIQGIIMGAGENNYLQRGRHFDVLRNVEGGVADKGISFCLTPGKGTPLASRGGATTPGFTPSRVLLANTERRMNLLGGPETPNTLHHADIETGKIVSTWTFQKDNVEIPMLDIHHDTKSGQLEERSTFMGLDKNRLCRWDLRDARGVVQESPIVQWTGGKDYSRGTNFTCMATSGDGYVAVGAQDGCVRMYSSKSLTRANTAIPGLGAPITAIDVTYDGKWVLATTDKYLMVVKTTFENDKGLESSAFTSRMGGRGAVPRLLRLKPEDAARTGGKTFAKGKFTWITESGMSERWVVANCGPFSVIWNFNKIKSCGGDGLSFGGLPTSMDYIMTAKDEEVVDAAFLHPKYASAVKGAGKAAVEQAALVVATPHRLFNMGS
eukprot:CAMPEP_0202869760 /NCGR_PEP_ID=MMETSP1391-20130828/12913_1 /ASSEMBLY_ACC=CAM_ASM_000867 /TAXON_ID=1034604 /ORGANISM="Chlamydomonas leiostraca, Strain SAG 11-49" /LENGTH=578 /DNA_ID=CAMNT_0049550119 /DNA_START=147 /DNA_END=1883 /DNA_ORIENTATION=+